MNLCKFQKRKILLTPFSDKGERGTNPTYKYFTHLREASNVQYFSHEIPHVQTHFSLFRFSFFLTPNNCSFIKRNERNPTSTRVSKQQKNGNRFENENERDRKKNFCNIFNNFLVKFPNRDYCYAI